MQEAPILRPLSVGDIIDRILRLFRANLILLLAIAVLPNLVVEVLQRASGLSQTFDFNDISAAFNTTPGRPIAPRQVQSINGGLAAAAVVIGVIFSLIQTAALTEAIGQRYLGRAVTIGEAYSRGLRASPRLLLSGLVVGVAFLAAFLVAFLIVGLLNASAALSAIALVIGILALFFVLPWTFLSLAVVGPAIVLEGLGPIAGIRRSFHLMDKARWRAFGLFFLIGLISSIIGLIFSTLFLASFVTEPTLRTVLQTIASVASSAVTTPLLTGTAVILYYDLRVRREAFDLQLAAEALPREG